MKSAANTDLRATAESGKSLPTTSPQFRARLHAVVKRLGRGNSVKLIDKDARTLSRYLSGTEPPMGVVRDLAAASGVSLDWLINGPDDSEARLTQSGTQQEQEESPVFQIHDIAAMESTSLMVVPIYEAKLSAGPGAVAISEQPASFAAFDPAYLRSIGVQPSSARLMQVRGRSQFPTLNDGEWVVVDVSVDVVVDDGLYAVGYGESMLVKRVQMMRDGSVLLASDNKAEGYLDEKIPRSELHELRIIGRVKQHLRTV